MQCLFPLGRQPSNPPSQTQSSTFPAILLPGRRDGSVFLENDAGREQLWKGTGFYHGE